MTAFRGFSPYAADFMEKLPHLGGFVQAAHKAAGQG
jgi:hypothetical protein